MKPSERIDQLLDLIWQERGRNSNPEMYRALAITKYLDEQDVPTVQDKPKEKSVSYKEAVEAMKVIDEFFGKIANIEKLEEKGEINEL